MFIPVCNTERSAFMAQTIGSFIPGYTGHCPTLRFRFGRCYGTNTKEILQDLRDKGVYKQVQREPYRQPDQAVLTPIIYNKGQARDYSFDTKHRCPKYVLGYTGYVPGYNFRYGKSYGRTADDSRTDFDVRQSALRRRKFEMDQAFRAKSAPRMNSIRAKDEVERVLKDYVDNIKYKVKYPEYNSYSFQPWATNSRSISEKIISPEFPPIAGYTGHIPKVKGTEESLSQRYHSVAKRGLSLLKQERESRNVVDNAEQKIHNILSEAKEKYPYHV